MKGLVPLACVFFWLVAGYSFAGSASWNLRPTTNSWNTTTNWTPATVPNGPNDVATFDVSQTVALSVLVPTEVNQIVFNPGASAFTVTVSGTNNHPLTISGVGITNNSGVTQDFAATLGFYISFIFTNSANAGSLTQFTNSGGTSDLDFETQTVFYDTSSAGYASFSNLGGKDEDAPGGQTIFRDSSTAANAVFSNQSGTGYGYGGAVLFFDNSSAANAVIDNQAGGSQYGIPAQAELWGN